MSAFMIQVFHNRKDSFGSPLKSIMRREFSMKKPLTLKQIANIISAEIPASLQARQDEIIYYIAGERSWAQKDSVLFSRYYGPGETQAAMRALKNGAKFIFSSKQLYDGNQPLPCIVLPDPQRSFSHLMRTIRSEYSLQVIAITGSVGKTTTKDMLDCIISRKYSCIKSNQNANSGAAIANMIQSWESKHEVCVQEVGAWEPGYIKNNGYMLNPDMAIITNIGYPHIDLYGSIEKIYEDKISLIDNLAPGGVAFLNIDDAFLAKTTSDKQIISFGIKNTAADYLATNIQEKDGIITFDIQCAEGVFPIVLHMVGEHNVLNALVAFAVGRKLNIAPNTIIAALAEFKSDGLRQNIVDIGGYSLYVDCYNSAPNSVVSSVHSLAGMHEFKKRVAVLGNIPRMGDMAAQVHREVAAKLAGEAVDVWLLFGKYMKEMYDVLSQAGCNVRHTTNRMQLNEWIHDCVAPGDIVLFKAGHPMALAKTIDQVYGTSFHLTDSDVLLESSRAVNSGDFNGRWIDGAVELRRPSARLMQEKYLELPFEIGGTPVTRVGNEAFPRASVTSLRIPGNISNLGFACFYLCKALKTVAFSAGLKVIEQSAFNNCYALEAVELPETLIHIGPRAFYKCNSLKRAYIPLSVRYIAEDAFSGCQQLIIQCHADSYAEEYAQAHHIAYELVDKL